MKEAMIKLENEVNETMRLIKKGFGESLFEEGLDEVEAITMVKTFKLINTSLDFIKAHTAMMIEMNAKLDKLIEMNEKIDRMIERGTP
jgi:hypothetical protein